MCVPVHSLLAWEWSEQSPKMWKVVLCLCVASWGLGEAQLSRSHFQLDIQNVSMEMMKELSEAMNLNVRLLMPNINVSYSSKYEFDMRGMGPLYNHTEEFIDVIANGQAYPEGMFFALQIYIFYYKTNIWPTCR